MLKITGVILCIAGAAGYGVVNIAGWNRALRELDEWILLLENMKSQIHYRRDIIEEVFCAADESIYGIAGKYVSAVGHELKNDRTKSLVQAWNMQMISWKKDSYLSDEIKKSILAIPEYMNEQECDLQINRLDFLIHGLYAKKEKLERETEIKKKPVMAISLAGGITAAVLLV